jgi:hypothetical protein
MAGPVASHLPATAPSCPRLVVYSVPDTKLQLRSQLTKSRRRLSRACDLRDHNLNLPSALSQLLEPQGPRPALPPNRRGPLVTAHAHARPLWHGPSADRRSGPVRSPTPAGAVTVAAWPRKVMGPPIVDPYRSRSRRDAHSCISPVPLAAVWHRRTRYERASRTLPHNDESRRPCREQGRPYPNWAA